jgi:hypothetical protein
MRPKDLPPMIEAFENVVELEDEEVVHVLHPSEWWEPDWMEGEFDIY